MIAKKQRSNNEQKPRLDVLGQRLLRDDKRAVLKLARRVYRVFNGELDVGLTFVHDLEMRALNRAWRKKDEPTDVLSFPNDPTPGSETVLGDLVISVDTARRQAHALDHELDVEVAVLVAHGLCHLAGLDHESGADQARVQLACERALLAAARVDVAAALTGRTSSAS
jgi:probable rRNA maturation factor